MSGAQCKAAAAADASARARARHADTSLISAFISAQVGRFQLAVAARHWREPEIRRADPRSRSLLDAAQQSFAPLANVPAGLGTNLDVSV